MLAFGAIGTRLAPDVFAQVAAGQGQNTSTPDIDSSIKDYLHKMKNFDQTHRADILLDERDRDVFSSVVERLNTLQSFYGHGDFQTLGFERGLSVARYYSEIGEFTRKETAFMEKIFYTDARVYGFFGNKPLKEITDEIRIDEVIKVPYTGNHLYRGQPLDTYRRIKEKLGDDVILTSGIRGVMKQFLLFFNKAYSKTGNLSLASRSLAPPGYSFHGIGDFDVGQVGLGYFNFTARFITTKVYRRLSELGYLKLRYPDMNLLGVRFEPWHIEIGGMS